MLVPESFHEGLGNKDTGHQTSVPSDSGPSAAQGTQESVQVQEGTPREGSVREPEKCSVLCSVPLPT